MKVAVQSLLWGAEPSDLGQVFREARAAGYEGIELAVRPDRLQECDLVTQLLTHRMFLVGIARGSIADKINLVESFRKTMDERFTGMPHNERKLIDPGPEYPYVYVDESTDLEFCASHPEITFALHPHMFKSVQTLQEATACLNRYPNLRFLPDTAHLRIAGDDPEEAIKQQYQRLIGVHLKDWRAEYGRSYQFYARGFVDLGKGDCEKHLRNVVTWLKEVEFDGWLVVEKDRASESPLEDAMENRSWLRNELSV